MDLSVVVPTLNGREKLVSCLDSLAEHAPGVEVIVVNGPSTDGTSGMVRDRDDVDVLVEVADRNVNVARNAGIETATGDVIALVGHDLVIEPGWVEAIAAALESGASVATGPTHLTMQVGMTTDEEETRAVAGREVTFFNGDNVAFTRKAIEAVDGFDEWPETGGARDCSHRIAGLGGTVAWNGDMCVRGEFGADGGTADWSGTYRALTYRLLKNYGVRPAVVGCLLERAFGDAGVGTRSLLAGETPVSTWFGGVRSTVVGVAAGTKDGLRARLANQTPARNPHGISARDDRAVEVNDWR
jgi:glycosyltransferase involved in cell wall biosynthesis